MNGDAPPDRAALAIAEDVLRAIYGDDLTGCKVTLDEIGHVIQRGLSERGQPELLDLYEKLVQAIHLLSTPPEPGKVVGAPELQALLGQRLDTIHTLTTKAIATTESFKKARDGGGES